MDASAVSGGLVGHNFADKRIRSFKGSCAADKIPAPPALISINVAGCVPLLSGCRVAELFSKRYLGCRRFSVFEAAIVIKSTAID